MPSALFSPISSPSRRVLAALLLTGSALSAQIIAQPAQAQSTDARAPTSVTLDTVVIDGSLESPIGGGTGYLATNSATAFKGGVPLTETPQSVSTVTEKELDDRKPRQIQDALAYVPGVTAGIWGVDDRFDQFLIRGFDLGTSGIYRDSLPNKAQNFSGFKIEPYMVQRIDVLRGPSSVIYGSNDAAGMINVISKRPKFENFAEGQLSYGSHKTASVGVDAGGVLDPAKTLAWRVTALRRDGSTAIHDSDNDRSLIALGLTWAPTDQTEVTFLGQWQKDALTPNSFMPVAGEDYPARFGDLPKSFTRSQSPFNRFATEQYSFGWQARHDLSEQLTFRQNYRHARQKTDYRHLYFNGMHDPDWNPTEDSMNFAAFAVDEVARQDAIDNQLEYRSTVAGAENRVLLGVDYTRQQVTGTAAYDASYQVDIRNPSLNFPVAYPPIYSDSRTTVTEKGVYIQDHLKFDNGLSLTAGLRRSWLENRNHDRLSGTTTVQKDSATTGLFGLTYDLGNGFIPYASFTQGFTANIGRTFAGEIYQPTKGRQWEAGLRYAPTDRNLLISGAIFDITKTNVLTSDPSNPGFSVQTGEVRHRGLELEARGNLTEQLSLIGGYTYLDPKITRSNDGDAGHLTPLAPRHQASVWLDYDFSGAAQGLSLGGGGRYIGATWGDTANTRRVSAYTLADVSLRYEWDAYVAALNVTNLFNKEYFATCDASVGCITGAGREATLTLSRRF
ncbi:TonB-dependent siderophore receptor [Paracoccus aminophilus]|uniref:TonB-dependent siderophore receptor n=1 Tax=Paracoccus aminophilus JCM 7686 TaxID=1367847 RepID=S5Y4U0_PARAH|nr:TonB-dependent siderophore receptor [Paracoccus aminophilus]AGT10755.1 TonB-dependent siderophore receptor [Paracoccus aminophilus JCM 7686]